MKGRPRGSFKPDPRIPEAAAMRERGATYRQIAEHFGVHLNTATRWLNPERAAAAREGSRQRAARSYERRKANGNVR